MVKGGSEGRKMGKRGVEGRNDGGREEKGEGRK